MKLGKKQENEVRKAYDAYWEGYFAGDEHIFASVLDDNFRMIGTSESEICKNKSDAIRFLRAQTKELGGKAELRNREIQVAPVNGLMLVSETADAYVLIDAEWKFYSKIRLSTFLHNTDSGWKIVHQHGSLPDSRVQAGETLALEQIKTENLQLRDAVKRHTIELEYKNRELEIEASLERARAVAMGMRKSDDLLVICEKIFTELQVLGFGELRNAMINIYDDAKNAFLNYDYSPDAGRSVTNFSYNTHPVIENQVKQIRSSQDAFSETVFAGKELNDWREFRKRNGERDDPRMNNLHALYYYFYSIGTGAIGISTFSSITEEKRNVLKRFRNVFNLSYQRYTDIQQAEAQAREAQIEASLERVRAQAMSMHKSEELINVCKTLMSELQALGFEDIRNTQIAIANDARGTYMSYDFYNNAQYFIGEISYDSHPFIASLARQMRQNKEMFINISLTGQELDDWRLHLKSLINKPAPRLVAATALHYYYYSIGPGGLGFCAYTPLNEEAMTVLKRFKNVFDLSYRRFMDIQKAEAQAREAQIEAALEKVRSRSLAMHRSDELQDVVRSVFERLHELHIELDTAIIIIFDEGTRDSVWWLVNSMNQEYSRILVQYDDNGHLRRLFESRENGIDFFSACYAREEKNALLSYLFEHTDFRYTPEDQKRRLLGLAFGSMSVALTRNIAIQVTRYSEIVFTDTENTIFRRFAKVFDQAYVRFLDLQKAEAQAREAQIETALEKVRAKVMAMSSSKDLNETSLVFGEQLRKLGIDWQFSYFWLIEEEKDDNTFWITWPDHQTSTTTYSLAEADQSFRDCIIAWQQQEKIHGTHVPVEHVQAWLDTFERITADAGGAAVEIMKAENFKDGVYYYDAMIKFGSFGILMNRATQEEEKNIQHRFAIEFERAYTRFLDLQKAEAQAREAQVEAALERVRARTMGMRHSTELSMVIKEVTDQMQLLGFDFDTSNIGTQYDEKGFYLWNALPGHEVLSGVYVPKANLKLIDWFYGDISSVDQIRSITFNKKDKDDFLSYYLTSTNARQMPTDRQNFLTSTSSISFLTAFRKDFTLSILNYRRIKYSDEESSILNRFANAFEQTYTRFLDLQKAEAQAREAQIEAALERVRSRTMGMHKSEELKEVIQVVYAQFALLNIHIDHTGFVMDYKARDDYHIWIADNVASPTQLTIPYFDCVYYNQFNEAKEKGLDFFATNLTFEEKNRFYEDLFKYVTGLPEEALEYLLTCPGLAASTVLLENVGLYIENFSGIPYTEEENNTLMRFGIVFQQTYTRFLDLQKAEAQTREAQIEASLERIRAKAMAMHRSEDVNQAVAVVFEELDKLNLDMLRCGIGIIDKEKRSADAWITSKSDLKGTVQISGNESLDIHPLLQKAYDAWLRQEDLTYVLEGEDLLNYYHTSGLGNVRLPDSQLILTESASKKQYYHLAAFQAGGLFAFRETPFPEEAIKIIKRFAGVFHLTYKRFLDLQKAEAQAREAQIEASLERVRSKTMAMHNSQSVSEATAVMFNELSKLDVHSMRCGICVLQVDSDTMEVWAATVTNAGHEIKGMGLIGINGHPLWQQMYHDWKLKKESFQYHLQGEDLKAYYHALRSEQRYSAPYLQDDPPDHYCYVTYFNEGVIFTFTRILYSEEQKQILKRFATVFSLTYRRYQDLKNAESQAREAIRQASIDRVRGQIASMRSTQDLQRITPLIWKELTNLQITFVRCGVFIMDDEVKIVHTYLSTPDGKDIAAMHLPYVGIPITEQVVTHWRKQTIYSEHWNKEDFQNWTRQLFDLGHITSGENYQAGPAPEQLHLHFIPFMQGMLYVGSTDPLPDDSLDLIQSLAEAFATAYARYEDFNTLEAAKKKTDQALADLESAKDQLVQQEKLASLGQLTAGIAHEIKNPLNFVNNFSEVSRELLDEMLEELEKGNSESVKSITDAIKSNLDKIHDHGSRADSIVKSMLMHSRGGSGQKEPTDLNALIREYVNLTFHGMRAGKQPINVQIDLKLDDTLSQLPVIVEDMSRVIINLCNNAFDAMRSKLSDPSQKSGYTPKLTVRTARNANHVLIEIADNGPGIPDDIKDKILQPFFTTKKGTQGTGLGLSITNDIVKAHGGELKVESREGTGSAFRVLLPY